MEIIDKTTTAKAVGERVRERRKQMRITQLCLGMRCDGLYQSTVSKIERGERYPFPETLSRLAMALGVSENWLKYGED